MAGQSTRKTDGGRIAGPAEIPNGVQLKMFFQLMNGKTAHTSCFGQHQGTFVSSAAMANQLFDAIKGHWSNRFSNYIGTGVTFQALSVRDMTLSTNPEFRSTTAPITGGAAGNQLPQDVAIVLTAQCVERGRGSKGRLYLPGWSAATLGSNGQMAAAVQTAVTAFGSDLLLEMNAVALSASVAKPARQA